MLPRSTESPELNKIKWLLKVIKKQLMLRKWDGLKKKSLHIRPQSRTRMEMRRKLWLTEMMELDHRLLFNHLENLSQHSKRMELLLQEIQVRLQMEQLAYSWLKDLSPKSTDSQLREES